ncbi:cytochrome c family protein [Ensifer sp. 2YAB10]|jgi:mono/diheme cytochrome c family protein|uniref:c-type cytochrome n=1 Tax=unclassified Ensifer TaxID=2633371 RepID=UPI000DE47ECE|nr:cytochrome C [Ensifer sp. SSB1]MBK5571356.1 cytochrome C [Ensifer sp. SSB1]
MKRLIFLNGIWISILLHIGHVAAADLAQGRTIAVRWCSECHIVAPGQGHGSDSVPTFAEISRTKDFNEAKLSAFLSAPQHSRMPNLSLTRSEIGDLVAYIKAQRPR